MNVTPAMQQFYDIKQANSDCVIFFRMWDFYEMFEEDAKIAHKILWITLTSRNKNADTPILLAWFPYHAKEKYLPQLVKSGYKVAIVEQISNPKDKGIVERKVTRIITPATLWLEWEDYESGAPDQMSVALVHVWERYGLSIMNFSLHEFSCSEFDNFESCATELYKLAPSEVILEKDSMWNDMIFEILSKKFWLNIYYYYYHEDSYKLLKSRFWVANLESFGIEKKSLAQKASALLLKYISENQQSDLWFIHQLKYKSFDGFMQLDQTTIRSLDLVYNLATASSKHGTLLWVIDETQTPMWKRFLREQILRPLQDIKEIQKRQSFISAFVEDKILLDSIRSELKYISDIDAILTRLSLERAGPRDLLSLKKSLISIRNIRDILKTSDNKILKNLLG